MVTLAFHFFKCHIYLFIYLAVLGLGCSIRDLPFSLWPVEYLVAACEIFQLWYAGGSVVKNPFPNARDSRDVGLIPELGRSPGVGNGNLF